ncbi:MAG: PhoU domain-containing protein [Ilumatobacter sp.]|uniref:PhoU domain-containing protein n=1 Tax=Ilumatobacter sp. TaxID=1967498 RepID=UPI00260BA95B|nr:PhoU domain-containing protein [Ilumatobacter sp.]MDJ0770377.1 PhoU domain-containing protein [Ilumatobacter sp.]
MASDDIVPTEGNGPTPDEAHGLLLRGITNRLSDEFSALLTRDTLEHYVHDSYRELSSKAKILTHIPAFVERFARQRLRALAKNTGVVEGHPPEVLFVCERNDAASQMAAALFTAAAGERASAHSAGAAPSAELVDHAVHALHEIGIDILGEFPKPVSPEIEQAADVIVTLDAHDDVPIVDGKHYVAWRLPDRHDDGIDGYRALRDELETKVADLIAEVVPPAPPPTHVAFDADLAELESLLGEMAEAVVALAQQLWPAVDSGDPGRLAEIADGDEPIDTLDERIETMTMHVIARRQPVASDLRTILAVNDAALHLERIADAVVDVASIADEENLAAGVPILPAMIDQMIAMTREAHASLADRDADRAHGVELAEASMNDWHDRLLAMLLDSGATLDRRTVLALDRTSRLLKRAGHHAVDVAEQAVFIVTGEHVEFGRSARPTGLRR